jgi:hypothetical protein
LGDAGEVEVIDPTHPLYGRSFPIHSISQPVNGPGHVFVIFREHMRLRIPLAATRLASGRLAAHPTKFTPEAIQQLLAFVKEYESPCLINPPLSGNDSPPV